MSVVRKTSWVMALLFGSLLAGAVGNIALAQDSSSSSPNPERAEALEKQVRELRTIIDAYNRKLDVANSKWNELQLAYLKDWYDHNRQLMKTREEAFTRHGAATTQIHWVVIVLVVSASAVSIFEIFYGLSRKAPAGNGGATSQELEISSNKVRLVTTVSGFVLLLITFAFFSIYVRDVYSLRTLDDRSQEKAPLSEGAGRNE